MSFKNGYLFQFRRFFVSSSSFYFSFFAVIIACCFVNIIIKFVSYFRKVRDLSPSKRKAEMEKIQVVN